MTTAREELQQIHDQIKKGVVPPPQTVRSFLLWFGAERRGYNIVRRIRSTLESLDLDTDPEFEYAYIDGSITFVPAGAKTATPQQASDLADVHIAGPTYRIGRLESANRQPVTVKPDNQLSEATTLMLMNDFSQLPVVTSPRDVKGVISWKLIGSRLALGRSCQFVRECMDPPHTVGIQTSLFAAIEIIAVHDYVLVQAADRTISGIVTASDLSQQFRFLAEPFLLVGEIENNIRRLIHGKFTADELRSVVQEDDRDVDGVVDLTFGEYQRLLESDSRWAKLRLKIDRREFVARLDEVREIRNDVMHFDPEGPAEAELKTLRDFARFMQSLREIGAV